jgi:hypothetical protein
VSTLMRQVRSARLSVGDVIEVAQMDYVYGTGSLKLRLTAAIDTTHCPSMEWVAVAGVEIQPDGCEGRARSVLVRHVALVEQSPATPDPGATDGPPAAAS